MKKITLLLVAIISSLSLYADEEIDPLLATQNLLRDLARVQKEALTTPEAKSADFNASIITLGNAQNKQELYNISADLMSWLVETTKGDPAKMAELMAEAQKNPRAFYERIPSAAKAKIKALSGAIDSSRSKIKNP